MLTVASGIILGDQLYALEQVESRHSTLIKITSSIKPILCLLLRSILHSSIPHYIPSSTDLPKH